MLAIRLVIVAVLLWAVLLVDSSWFNSVVHSFGYRLFILGLFIICCIVGVWRLCVCCWFSCCFELFALLVVFAVFAWLC